jgi:hypothetical protein
VSADNEAVEWYSKLIHNCVQQYKFVPHQIYNDDNLRHFWMCLPLSTLAGASEKHATSFKSNKIKAE